MKHTDERKRVEVRRQLLWGAAEVEDNQPAVVPRTTPDERVALIEGKLYSLNQPLQQKLGESFE